MLFQVELSFEGVVDRLDDLPQRLEEPGARAGCFTGAGRAQQRDAVVVQRGLELAAVVGAVSDHRLTVPAVGERGVGVENAQQHLALVGLGPGEGEADRQAVQGAEQVQPQPQK
jgi:hypothetical protein